jgi:hypothetical protein
VSRTLAERQESSCLPAETDSKAKQDAMLYSRERVQGEYNTTLNGSERDDQMAKGGWDGEGMRGCLLAIYMTGISVSSKVESS